MSQSQKENKQIYKHQNLQRSNCRLTILELLFLFINQDRLWLQYKPKYYDGQKETTKGDQNTVLDL